MQWTAPASKLFHVPEALCNAAEPNRWAPHEIGGRMAEKKSRLKRPRHAMPSFVKQALEERGLMDSYKGRPAYQQNDYVGWINEAKRPETKEKRLQQMLEELEKGGVYMNMAHPPSMKTTKRAKRE
jgi:hypothetical protein